MVYPSDLSTIEIYFAIVVANRVKFPAPNHLQHGPAAALKRFGYVFNSESGSSRRFGIGWSESGVEQKCEPVFEYGHLPRPLHRNGTFARSSIAGSLSITSSPNRT